jgi:hypothetical protein
MYKMKLAEYTDEELKKEMERRETIKKYVPYAKSCSSTSWNLLYNLVTNQVISLEEGGKVSAADFKQLVFEIVMESIYGKEIWDWWNDKARDMTKPRRSQSKRIKP